MRPDDRREDRRDSRREGQGGIPDGLLIGMLAFLLGMTVLVWTATGLAAWFAQGAWPTGVTFTRTPLAMRHLIGRPHDITGAWPDTPPSQLSGWGLFWGLFIAQLMILFVLTMFVLGTVARWRAGRTRRAAAGDAGNREAGLAGGGSVWAGPPGAGPGAAGPMAAGTGAPGPMAAGTVTAGTAAAGPTPVGPVGTGSMSAGAVGAGAGGPAEPVLEGAAHGLAPQQDVPAPRREAEPLGGGDFAADGERVGGWERIHIAPRERRHTTATHAIQTAPGPTLIVTSNPTLWSDTKDAKAKLGPTLLYDPTHLCDTPARLHWSPTSGCEDKQTALHRATALLAPVRPTAKIDQAVADTATTLLRSYLHAAALENRTIRHVHRWSQGTQVQEAVRTLRTHPKAAPGAAGELEAALTAHPERRDIAQELTGRALAALSTVNIREACTPNRNDALALDSFIQEGGTLYVVGESIEDPRSNPGAMPLLTALVSSVVERGRRMAERSSSGRLDPPLTLVLDDIAAVAPFPELPTLLATGTDRGLPTLALLRSREQARSRWPHQELPV
ncbi:type VI secretion protein [Streptomyces sp. Ru62]|uniref:type IV secretory system conjugative DNA transfer family protein n=1 Tax=Streptomyces sp. Ru62 TaxID=2080745 RepID=UPI000CDDE816|nr:type IV secretory system conjugative DNA transfer family protein [Streptomyces sp. Ru62]POX65047.1 type VI secretion protein [Streptomyces sp. Ru62]